MQDNITSLSGAPSLDMSAREYAEKELGIVFEGNFTPEDVRRALRDMNRAEAHQPK